MKWISVKDKLPEIPEGRYAVSVLVAEFDSTYEELNPGNGYSVYECSYGRHGNNKLFDESKENDFMTLYCGEEDCWGPTGDPVTHWMYLPDPPGEEDDYETIEDTVRKLTEENRKLKNEIEEFELLFESIGDLIDDGDASDFMSSYSITRQIDDLRFKERIEKISEQIEKIKNTETN